MDMPYGLTVRGVIKNDNGEILIVKRHPKSRTDPEMWELPGGKVEKGEDLESAIKRELLEELGAVVDVVCKIGVVSDYYNLIHRHNINNYYLCKVKSFIDKNLTDDERDLYHLSTLKLTYDEAVAEYALRRDSMLGRIIGNRETPVLEYVKDLI